MDICLSNRLMLVVSMVKSGKACDVGTDHGYVPVYLIQKGIAKSVVASDIRKGPLESARHTASEYGLEELIDLRLSDGLEAIRSEEADTVIIAGMGGETIIGILSKAPWTKNKRIVMQPQSKEEELAGWLVDNGYVINNIGTAKEGKRIYICMSSDPNETALFGNSIAELLCNKNDPLLADYINAKIEKLTQAGLQIKKSETERAAEMARKIEEELDYLRSIINDQK